MEVLRLLAPCQGYENGKTIDDIARAIYEGACDFRSKAIARQLIGAARKATRRQGINADIFSIKPVGTLERRYCHLTTVVEYTKAINDFEIRVEGEQQTEEGLKQRRETVEQRRRIEEARKTRAKKIEEKQKQDQE